MQEPTYSRQPTFTDVKVGTKTINGVTYNVYQEGKGFGTFLGDIAKSQPSSGGYVPAGFIPSTPSTAINQGQQTSITTPPKLDFTAEAETATVKKAAAEIEKISAAEKARRQEIIEQRQMIMAGGEESEWITTEGTTLSQRQALAITTEELERTTPTTIFSGRAGDILAPSLTPRKLPPDVFLTEEKPHILKPPSRELPKDFLKQPTQAELDRLNFESRMAAASTSTDPLTLLSLPAMGVISAGYAISDIPKHPLETLETIAVTAPIFAAEAAFAPALIPPTMVGMSMIGRPLTPQSALLSFGEAAPFIALGEFGGRGISKIGTSIKRKITPVELFEEVGKSNVLLDETGTTARGYTVFGAKVGLDRELFGIKITKAKTMAGVIKSDLIMPNEVEVFGSHQAIMKPDNARANALTRTFNLKSDAIDTSISETFGITKVGKQKTWFREVAASKLFMEDTLTEGRFPISKRVSGEFKGMQRFFSASKTATSDFMLGRGMATTDVFFMPRESPIKAIIGEIKPMKPFKVPKKLMPKDIIKTEISEPSGYIKLPEDWFGGRTIQKLKLSPRKGASAANAIFSGKKVIFEKMKGKIKKSIAFEAPHPYAALGSYYGKVTDGWGNLGGRFKAPPKTPLDNKFDNMFSPFKPSKKGGKNINIGIDTGGGEKGINIFNTGTRSDQFLRGRNEERGGRRGNNNINNLFGIGTRTGEGTRLGLGAMTDLFTGTKQATRTKQELRTRQKFRKMDIFPKGKFGMGGTAFKPFAMPTPKTPKKRPRGKGLGRKQKTKYSPSLTASIFGIKGKAPKGLLTGGEIRPLPSGTRKGKSKGRNKIEKMFY